MILGFDHLALSSADVPGTLASLASSFVLRFHERGIANHPAKRPFLEHWQDTHELAFVEPVEGPSIEITSHGSALAASRGPFGIDPDGVIRIDCRDAESESDFWAVGLGFRKLSDPSRLELARPVPRWSCRLRLTPVLPEPERSFLDSAGHACLALLCSDIESDIHRATSAGAVGSSGIFDMVVGGKNVRIAMMRSPGGAICELVQPVKGIPK